MVRVVMQNAEPNLNDFLSLMKGRRVGSAEATLARINGMLAAQDEKSQILPHSKAVVAKEEVS